MNLTTSKVSILGKLASEFNPKPFKDKWSKFSYNSKVCLWSSLNSVMLLKSSSKTNSSICIKVYVYLSFFSFTCDGSWSPSLSLMSFKNSINYFIYLIFCKSIIYSVNLSILKSSKLFYNFSKRVGKQKIQKLFSLV